jgi:hypothetical protein
MLSSDEYYNRFNDLVDDLPISARSSQQLQTHPGSGPLNLTFDVGLELGTSPN